MTKIANMAPSLPANFSIHAALSQGLLSHNTQVVTINGVAVSKSIANPTVAHLLSTGVLNPSMSASVLGVAPHFGGD
jgi:hypothetical protein